MTFLPNPLFRPSERECWEEENRLRSCNSYLLKKIYTFGQSLLFFEVLYNIFPRKIRSHPIEGRQPRLAADQQHPAVLKTDDITLLGAPFFREFRGARGCNKAHSIRPILFGEKGGREVFKGMWRQILKKLRTARTPIDSCQRYLQSWLRHPGISEKRNYSI